MNKIKVTETQATTNAATFGEDNIAYVPGFALGGEAEAREPVYCADLETFHSYFGNVAPMFLTNQYYPKVTESSESGEIVYTGYGFKYTEIPGATTSTASDSVLWFTAGTSDPAFRYAEALISAGIPVVYERLNYVGGAEAELEYSVPSTTAREYSSTATYSVGDLCLRKATGATTKTENWYICISEISTAEAWTAAHWAAYKGYQIYSITASYEVGDIVGHVEDGDVVYYACNTAIVGGETWTVAHWTALEEAPATLHDYDITVDNYYYQVIGIDEYQDIGQLDENIPGSVFVGWTGNPMFDRGEYSAKFLTTGGYPNFNYVRNNKVLHTAIISAAATRQDAIGIIDHTDYRSRPLVGSKSVYAAVKNGLTNGEYATMFTPWAVYNSWGQMPGSLAYLTCLGSAETLSRARYAIAGVQRGLVSDIQSLHTARNLSNSVAESYQADPTEGGGSINPITYINPYGYCIWGNRTLVNGSTKGFATIFLNQRSILCDIKKRIYRAATLYMFDTNDDELWDGFSGAITELLDTMLSEGSIEKYTITKRTVADKTKLSAVVEVVPQYAVESFDIYVNMTDEDVTVSSEDTEE